MTRYILGSFWRDLTGKFGPIFWSCIFPSVQFSPPFWMLYSVDRRNLRFYVNKSITSFPRRKSVVVKWLPLVSARIVSVAASGGN